MICDLPRFEVFEMASPSNKKLSSSTPKNSLLRAENLKQILKKRWPTNKMHTFALYFQNEMSSMMIVFQAYDFQASVQRNLYTEHFAWLSLWMYGCYQFRVQFPELKKIVGKFNVWIKWHSLIFLIMKKLEYSHSRVTPVFLFG